MLHLTQDALLRLKTVEGEHTPLYVFTQGSMMTSWLASRIAKKMIILYNII